MNRRIFALSFSLALSLVSACGSDPTSFGGDIPPATFVVITPGAGATNALPLDPLVTGTRTDLRTVVGHREGGLIEVAYTMAPAYALADFRFVRHHSYYRRGENGLEFLGTAGDLVGQSETRSVAPMLVVPNVVRYGMTWTTGRNEETGQPIQLSVTGRSEEQTPFGLGVVWTIEFAPGTTRFSDPMRFLEGVGMLADFGEPVRGRQTPYISFILPQTEPATDASVPATSSNDVPLPSELSEYEENLRVEGVTSLERPNGRRLLAVVGVETAVDAFSLLPFGQSVALCLEYEGGSFVSGHKIFLTQSVRFPYFEDTEPPLDTTPCNGMFDFSSVVRRPSDEVQLTMSRLGTGTTAAIQNNNGEHFFPSLFLAKGEEDPWVLVANAESFLLHGPQHGAVTVVNGNFPMGKTVGADWGLLTVYDFHRTGGSGRRDGYYFAPSLTDLSAANNAFYHLTPHGLLARSTVNMDGVGRFEPLFSTLDDLTLQTNEEAAHRALTTTPDGIVRRVVLENGNERLETLGRVELAAGEQLRAAIEVGNAGETLVFVNNYSGPVILGGNDCRGCTRFPFQPTRMRARRIDFASPASRYTPPAALSITARNVGTDVVVCWGQTNTAFDASGWTLGGKPVTAVAVADAPCAIAIRNPSTTTAELTLAGAYAVEANVPDVGMVRIAMPERDAPQLSGAATMLGDLAITPLSQVWHVAGFSYGVAPYAFFTNSVFDDLSGVWSRDQHGGLFYRGERTHELTPSGDFPGGSYFDLAAPVLGGGAVVSARPLEAFAFAGPAYLLAQDGTVTRLADSTPTDRQVWLANGRSCSVGTAITCFAPNATAPDMTIAVSGVSFATSKLLSFDATTALAIASGMAYRIDLSAGTATLIAGSGTGLIQPNATRDALGALWAPVWPGPDETDAPQLRIARIRADGVDIHEIPAPAYVDASTTVTQVYPGERLFAVSVDNHTLRFAPPTF